MTLHRTGNYASLLAASIAAIVLASPAAAQEQSSLEEDPPPPPDRNAVGQVHVSVSADFEQQFSTNVDSGGDIKVSRAGFQIGSFTRLTHDVDLSLSMSYEYDTYEFGGATTLGGGNPWDDIHTISLGAKLTMPLDQDWTIFGGPVFQIARESDANWDDAWTAGGYVGATLRVSHDLVIGGGFGAVSQIQDSTRFFPVFVIDWQITNEMRLTNRSGSAGRTGVELVQDLGDGWEIGVGFAYTFKRFRLDDDDGAPDGVGEETSLPVWIRLSMKPSAKVNVSFVGGFTFGGDLEIEAGDGEILQQTDYDPAGLLGITASIRF